MHSNNPLVITVAEFCDKYRIDRASYYRNARRGLLPAAIKVGGSTRILVSDEQSWLAGQRAAVSANGGAS